MGEARTPEEARGYSKGYAAGLRRKRNEGVRERAAALREVFIQRMMISIAPQLIASPWGVKDKSTGQFTPHSGAEQIMRSVRSIAERAAANCDFGAIALATPTSTIEQEI